MTSLWTLQSCQTQSTRGCYSAASVGTASPFVCFTLLWRKVRVGDITVGHLPTGVTVYTNKCNGKSSEPSTPCLLMSFQRHFVCDWLPQSMLWLNIDVRERWWWLCMCIFGDGGGLCSTLSLKRSIFIQMLSSQQTRKNSTLQYKKILLWASNSV